MFGLRKKRIAAIAAAVLLVVAVLIYHLIDRTSGTVGTSQILALDVGEGSATLIRTDSGNILIDAGPENAQETLCEHLRQMGIREFALIIFTHPDEDHIGGGDAVLRAFPVREIWTNGAADSNDSYDALIRTADATGKAVPMRSVSAGEISTVGDVTLTVLSPLAGEAEADNEGGLVLMLTCGGKRVLLAGDAGEKTEKRLLQRLGADALRADVLIAGHHGSNSASSAAFLAAVSPKEIVISCGAGNEYGHPDGRALERMHAVCDTIRRTDLEGDVRIVG